MKVSGVRSGDTERKAYNSNFLIGSLSSLGPQALTWVSWSPGWRVTGMGGCRHCLSRAFLHEEGTEPETRVKKRVKFLPQTDQNSEIETILGARLLIFD